MEPSKVLGLRPVPPHPGLPPCPPQCGLGRRLLCVVVSWLVVVTVVDSVVVDDAVVVGTSVVVQSESESECS